MKKVRITVMRTARCDDLIERYESPIRHACHLPCGDGFRPVSFLTEAPDEEAGG